MKIFKKITILIPCHNEERGIGSVIDGIPKRLLQKIGFKTEIIVINNNSTDHTAQVAAKRKVTVIIEKNKGKGNAIRAGFHAISQDTSYVVMLDGDNTYKSYEMLRLLEPLINNFADVIIGSRLGGKIKENSWTIQNRIANWGYTFLVRQFYRANITDVLSGYFAWKKEVIDQLLPYLESKEFEIEMEMITKMKKFGFQMYSVPITYDQREGKSKIQALRDGIRVLKTFFKYLGWFPKKKTKRSLVFSTIQ